VFRLNNQRQLSLHNNTDTMEFLRSLLISRMIETAKLAAKLTFRHQYEHNMLKRNN